MRAWIRGLDTVVTYDWTTVTINKNITSVKKDSTDWSYPWYMIKHKDGHFENILGEQINTEDTTKIYHNSYCYSFVQEDTTSRLKFAGAKKNNKAVSIKLFDESASNNESLELEIENFKKFKPTYKINYVFSYDSIGIEFKKKYLEINKNTYEKGENIIGKVYLEFEEKIYNNRKIKSSIKEIKGSFEVKIE